MQKPRRLAATASATVLLLLAAACSGGSGKSSTQFEPTDVTGVINGELPADGPPEYGGRLVITDPSDPPTLDPHKAASAYTQLGTSGLVYSNLVAYKHGRDIPYYSQEYTGDLAESWDISDDGKTWTFHLRKGVKFQNIAPVSGREFTAADVVCTVDRIQSLPGVQANLMEIVASVTTPDPYTAVFNLKSPYGALHETMASFYMSILPCEGTRGQFDLATQPIGTGPFQLQTYNRPVSRLYVKNPDYFVTGKPYLNEVEVLTMSDPAALLAGFRAGELDVTGVSVQLYPSLTGSNPDAVVVSQEGVTPQGLFMNEAVKPFDDIRVRKAISMAWDRKGMGEANYHSYTLFGAWPGVEMGGLTNDEAEAAMPYNPEGAKKLLAEAGYPNGFSVDLLTSDGWGPTIVNQAQWIQQDLKDIGVNLNLQIRDYATWYSTWQQKDYSIGFGYFTGFMSTNEWLKSIYPTDGSRNWMNMSDPALDAMILDQEATLDQEERADKLKDINQYILKNRANPILGMQAAALSVRQTWLHNYYIDPAYARGWISEAWVDSRSPRR